MKSVALALTLLTAAASLFGCASSPTLSTPNPPATPIALAAIPGNWQMQLEDTSGPIPTFGFNLLGALSVQGSQVFGTFRASILSATPCVPPTQDIPFTGTIDSTNTLTLTSATFAGSVATLQFTVPLTKNITHGTAKISGGACASSANTLIAVYVPPVTGTYTGTFTPIQLTGQPATTNTAGPATLTLTQATVDADGRFPVTGTLTFASTSCTVAPTAVNGIISGIALNLSPSNTQPVTLGTFVLIVNSNIVTSTSVNVTFEAFGNPATCPTGLYRGDLTRQ